MEGKNMEKNIAKENKNSSNLTQYKLDKNYSKKLIENNLEKLPPVIKEKLENALKMKKTNSLVVNEEYYKSKENSKGKQKHKNFVYELIPSDNYEKNNKKTFSIHPEKNLIDTMKIEKILRNGQIPLQEKVKNFDIQYEMKIEEFRIYKGENTHFHQQFHKFYRNGDYVDFEPFKGKNDNVQEVQRILEKKIFDEIITAYEKKNYRIPEIVKKNIFEITPMLVDLRKIKEFYNVPKRLEDPAFMKDIKIMLAINSNINSEGKSNIKDFVEYCESDFLLNNAESANKEHNELRKNNRIERRKNLRLHEYMEEKALELKKILEENVFVKAKIQEEINNKEDTNPNKIFEGKSLSIGKQKNNQNKSKASTNKNLISKQIDFNAIELDKTYAAKVEQIEENLLKKQKEETLFEKINNGKIVKLQNTKTVQKNHEAKDIKVKTEPDTIEFELPVGGSISPIRKPRRNNHLKETSKEIIERNNPIEILMKTDSNKNNKINNKNPNLLKKCFKTQDSVKKRHKKDLKNNNNKTSSFQEIQPDSTLQDSEVEYKKSVSQKARMLNDKINNIRLKNQLSREELGKNGEQENNFLSANLKKILKFQLFDEVNLQRIEALNKSNSLNNESSSVKNKRNNSYNKNNNNNFKSTFNNHKLANESNYTINISNNNTKILNFNFNIKKKTQNLSDVSKSKLNDYDKLSTNVNFNTKTNILSNLNSNFNLNNNSDKQSEVMNKLSNDIEFGKAKNKNLNFYLNPNKTQKESTNAFSSNSQKTNANSNSENISSQFSISNIKTPNLNIFNNVSVSDFTSKFSIEISQMQNTFVAKDPNLIQNNISTNNEEGFISSLNNEAKADKFVSDGNLLKAKGGVDLPKGFNKTNTFNANNKYSKKLMPIKLKNFHELKKIDHSKAIADLEQPLNSKENENADLDVNKEQADKSLFRSNSKVHLELNSNNNNEKLKSEVNINTINNTEENENSRKENYLESLYNRIANKNFHNLRHDLDEYIDLVHDASSKNEFQSLLENKSMDPVTILNRINNLKAKVKSENFNDKISNICAENNILNINPDGINKIRKLDQTIFKMDFELMKKII